MPVLSVFQSSIHSLAQGIPPRRPKALHSATTSKWDIAHHVLFFSPPFDSESPYPEVRAAVSSVDDVTIPVNTFRAWLLGLFYTVAVAAMNQIFNLRCQYIVSLFNNQPDACHQIPLFSLQVLSLS